MALDTISHCAGENDDEETFNRIYMAHRGSLCRFAQRFVTCKYTAEDIVHDVFLRLWERWSDRRPVGEINRYLYRAVRYGAIDVIRHEKVARDWKDRQSAFISVEPPVQMDPEYTLDRPEMRRRYERTLASLPERPRKVFYLSRSHGLTYNEIAVAMDVSVGQVERNMSKTLTALRSELTAQQ